MKKMNKSTQKALNQQAKEMGVNVKDNVRYDSERGYYIKGYDKFQKKQAVKAVDKGIMEGTLAERAHKRKKKMDEEGGF